MVLFQRSLTEPRLIDFRITRLSSNLYRESISNDVQSRSSISHLAYLPDLTSGYLCHFVLQTAFPFSLVRRLHGLFHDAAFTLTTTDEHIVVLEKELKNVPEQKEAVKLLKTIPGVGQITATTMIAEIGDIQRFHSPKALCNWAGLTPRVRSSAGSLIRDMVHRPSLLTPPY
jgi:transposase